MPGLYTDLIIHTLSMTINALPMSNLIYWGSLQVRVDIKQENTPVYSHEWQDPPAHLVHAPNKRVTLAAGKAVSCRFSVASITEPFSASFYMFLDMSEGGPVRTAQLVCSSFTLAAGELATLDVVYQVVPADSRLLKATAARVTLLEWTPPYQVLVASRLARCPLEDTFFYHDPNIVLLAEQEARQKETSLLVAPDLLPGDVFREIIEHYTLEPIVEPDPFPDPFDSLVTDSVWERVSGAIKTGLDDRSASGQQVRQLLDDPATVVAIGKTSYQREANYAVALNNVAPAAAVSNNSPVYRSGRSGQTAQLQAGSSVALGQMVSAYKPGFSLAEAGILQARETKFVFRPFCHSRTDAFIRKLSAGGLWGFLARGSQSGADTLSFKQNYHPNAEQVFMKPGDIPRNSVAFDFGDAYAPYNWELFFHIPMTIAGKLVRDQKFELAQKWYHVIFDPTASETGGKQRFWQFLPFYQEAGKQIKTLNELLADGTALLQQINLWEKNPFKPHIIARMRLSAYMKHVVMKYLDCLIGWADNLFGRDTLESINEAVNLYILAAKILGPRPERVPARAEPVDQTYNTLKDEKWLPLSNALVEIENFIPPSAGKGFHGWHADEPGTLHKQAVKAMETMLYFSIIRNDKLLSYWDTIADRLFKIRHSMNIAGVERTLALFEPPIDPALLVKAAAAGLDLGTVLNEVSGAARPVYRFAVMLQKARQFAQDLKLLGHDLLGYLEKRDAEGLALLRQNQDIQIMDSIQAIREANVAEAKKRAVSIQISLDAARGRRKFFSERTLTNASEQGYLASLQSALDDIGSQKITETIASVVAAIPDFKIGAPTSVGTTFGGSNLAKATMAIASYYSGGVGESNIEGARAAAMGGYERRMDDWKMQADAAKKEVEQLDNELLVSGIRREVSEHELATHNLHRTHSRELLDYLTRMFTAQELYDYLTGEVSAIYFQGYQLAVGMARKAQASYVRELNDTSASFIGFSYWDSLKKGLLAAERLVGDINRMEAAYIDNNKRNEFELTKHISLGLLDPARLIGLKTAGMARFSIPELLFDLDYPGHYLRRIKSVSVSIYCVTGPFTTVNATLRLVRHYTRTRLDTVAGDHYLLKPEDYQTGGESIATSGAQNDAGLFSCNFNDDRYLPFEGCGAVSEWDVMLVTEPGLRQFDYRTISDVVLHLKYTAREQAAAREAVMERMTAELAKVAGQAMPLYSFINVRTELSGEWASLLHPQPGASHAVTVPLDSNLFPYLARTSQTVIRQIGLYSVIKTGAGIPWTVSCRQGGELVVFDASLPVNRGSGLFEQTVTLPDNTCLDDIDEGKLQISSDTPIQPQDLADLIVTVQVRIAS